MSHESRYKVPAIEHLINRLIKFIFYWRLFWVLIALGVTVYFAIYTYRNSVSEDIFRNVGIVLTGGSIIIGIFYSLINYEHNQIKFKHDVKSSRELLTYTTASKMYGNELMENFKNIRQFYAENSELFAQAKWGEINEFWKKFPEIRLSFVIIFNFFECVSIGIEQNIMDEMFMKEFFKTVFKDYLVKYGTYLEYMRVEQNTDRIYNHFTKLANRWKNED